MRDWRNYFLALIALILCLVSFYLWWFTEERELTVFLAVVFIVTAIAFLYTTLHELFKASREHDAYLHPAPTRFGAAWRPANEVHTEHREAESEHQAWLRDISSWHRDHEKLLPLLDQLRSAIEKRDRLLDTHAAAIRHHQTLNQRHEETLAEHARAGEKRERGQWLGEHERLEKQHAEERERHRSLARDHERLKTGLGQLVEALGHA